MVLDLIMPVLDGLAFLDLIRSDPRFQQLPVLVVTAKVLSPLEKEQLRRQKLEFVKKAELSEEGFKLLLQRILQQAGSARKQPALPGQARRLISDWWIGGLVDDWAKRRRTAVHLSNHPFIQPSIYPTIHLSNHPFIQPSIYPSIHLSIHPGFDLCPSG